MAIRVLIVDDHGILRAGLRALLNTQPDLEVVGEAADGLAALRLADELCPDVVLLDLNMPGLNGLEVAARLKEKHPQLRLLILTAHEEGELLREAVKVGIDGYVIKRAADIELIGAIRAVHGGGLYVHPALTRSLLAEPVVGNCGEVLTPREVEVLRLITRGCTNRQAAESLGISVRTVESHRENLMAKLALRSRQELVSWAKEKGYLDSQQPLLTSRQG